MQSPQTGGCPALSFSRLPRTRTHFFFLSGRPLSAVRAAVHSLDHSVHIRWVIVLCITVYIFISLHILSMRILHEKDRVREGGGEWTMQRVNPRAQSAADRSAVAQSAAYTPKRTSREMPIIVCSMSGRNQGTPCIDLAIEATLLVTWLGTSLRIP